MSTKIRDHIRGGVGEHVRRVDGIPKVKGQFLYGSDLWAEDMLWGYTVRSPHPHARIARVDISQAVASPGVQAVLLAADVPGTSVYGLEIPDQPVLASDRVRYQGEPVAILAATDLEIARRAAERVSVTYEVLPTVADMEAALREDAPTLHERGNTVKAIRIIHGDPETRAEVWVEGYYETGMQDQAMLGPESGMAVPAEDGGVDIYVATQWLHVDQDQIAPCLGLPKDKVRLHLAGVGGAFGGREDVSMQIHAAMLALRTRRPVKMVYSREESFVGHVHRHPSRIWMRTGATRNGTLVAVQARILIDGGAYASSSPAVITNATTFAAGPYEVPHALLQGTAVYTNNPPCGAMRGFGAVQACFAYEAQMDKLADALKMDRAELRLRNALRTGSVLPTGQVIHGTAPVRELIRRCVDLPMPETSDERDPLTYPGGAGNVSRGEGLRRGVGFAVGYKNIGYSGGFDDSAECRVKLFATPSGPIAEVHSAAAEVGQGVHTVILQIARQELGIDHVVLHPADTMVGSAGSTSASRQTMMAGGATQLACRAVRDQLFERVRRWALTRGVALDRDLGIEDSHVVAGGRRLAPIVDFLDTAIAQTRVYHHRKTTAMDERGQGDVHVLFAFAAQRVLVEVDEDLGLVRVIHVATAQDVGKAIHPQGVYGQIEGGTTQGIGLAVMEEIQLKDGRILNPSFTDYLLPTILDIPTFSSTLVEEPEPGVPFGAKGVGELSTVVSTAAVVAALRDATGRELNRAPVRPDDLIGLTPPVRPRSA